MPAQVDASQQPQPRRAEPVETVRAAVDAFNDRDVERAVGCFTDDIVVTMCPEFPRLVERSHAGKAYLRKWAKMLVDGDFRIDITVQDVEGNHVRTHTVTWHKITRRLHLAPLVGIEDYVVENGKISRLTWTSSEESLRKLRGLRRRILALVGVVAVIAGVCVWALVMR